MITVLPRIITESAEGKKKDGNTVARLLKRRNRKRDGRKRSKRKYMNGLEFSRELQKNGERPDVGTSCGGQPGKAVLPER